MQYQAKLGDLLVQRLSEYRKKTSTNADDLLDDYTILLERRLAGENAESRTIQIKQMPVYQMLSYIISVVQCFRIGHIPGSVAPSKISACQDPVSATELQQTILSMAEKQIFQKGGTATSAIQQLAMAKDGQQINQQNPLGNQRWGKMQARAIGNQSKLFNEDVSAKLLLRNNQTDPRKQLQNQLAGGSNSFQQEIELARDGQAIYLRELDKEILTQSLTMLLSSLRIRFNAVTQTEFEVTPQEDIDHLTMIEQLASYIDPNAMEYILEMVQILKASIINSGANVLYRGIGINPQDEVSIIQDCLKELEPMIRVVQLFDTDITSTGAMYAEFSQYCLLSLVDYNRLRKEEDSRYDKRLSMFESATDPVIDAIDGPDTEQIENQQINSEVQNPDATATNDLPIELAQPPGQLV